MVNNNRDPHGTAFTASIDHVSTTTGISAHERYDTIRALTEGGVKPSDFNAPRHIFPLVAKDGGVLERMGHCEIMNDDGRIRKAGGSV